MKNVMTVDEQIDTKKIYNNIYQLIIKMDSDEFEKEENEQYLDQLNIILKKKDSINDFLNAEETNLLTLECFLYPTMDYKNLDIYIDPFNILKEKINRFLIKKIKEHTSFIQSNDKNEIINNDNLIKSSIKLNEIIEQLNFRNLVEIKELLESIFEHKSIHSINYLQVIVDNLFDNFKKNKKSKEDYLKVKIQNKKNINVLENKQEELQSKLNNDETENKNIQEELKRVTQELEEERKLKKELEVKKEVEKEQVKESIDIITQELENYKTNKEHVEGRIVFFEKMGKYGLIVSTISFIFYMLILTDLTFSSYKLNMATYISLIFPIIFPSVISFLAFNQSNIKKRELKEINEYFLYVHNIKIALYTLNSIDGGEIFLSKFKNIIDKIIDNTLPHKQKIESENKTPKDEEKEDSNIKLDSILKLLEKSNSN